MGGEENQTPVEALHLHGRAQGFPPDRNGSPDGIAIRSRFDDAGTLVSVGLPQSGERPSREQFQRALPAGQERLTPEQLCFKRHLRADADRGQGDRYLPGARPCEVAHAPLDHAIVDDQNPGQTHALALSHVGNAYQRANHCAAPQAPLQVLNTYLGGPDRPSSQDQHKHSGHSKAYHVCLSFREGSWHRRVESNST